jgi:hypothetical protein
MTDDDRRFIVSVMAASAVNCRKNIVERSRPPASRLAYPAILNVGGRESRCRHRPAKMAGMRQIISVAPEASMNHDDESSGGMGSWKSEVDKLTALFAVRQTKIGGR